MTAHINATPCLSGERGIQAAYDSQETAVQYVEKRFTSELFRLLHDRQVGAVRSVISRIRAHRVLEVAPGPGRITREIALDGELTCLEYNQAMIWVGRKVCSERVHWIQANAFEMEFESPFDLAYSFRFIRHFGLADRNRLYARFRNALRPGGYLVMDAVNNRVSGPLRRANPQEYPIYDKLYWSEKELRDELRQAGFEVETVKPVQRWFSVQSRLQRVLGPRSQWLCRLAVRAAERMRRGPALEWIVTCRRA